MAKKSPAPTIQTVRYRAALVNRRNSVDSFKWYVFNEEQAITALASPLFVEWLGDWVVMQHRIIKAED